MSEMDFPSGPWTGFYNYGSSTRKHQMDLTFREGKGIWDYGNCQANQAAFKFGHSGKRKLNEITTLPKGQRH